MGFAAERALENGIRDLELARRAETQADEDIRLVALGLVNRSHASAACLTCMLVSGARRKNSDV